MNLNSRLGKPNNKPEETAEDVVLLALVVSVMNAVASEAAKELGEMAEPAPVEVPAVEHPLMTLLPAPNRDLTPEQVIKIQLSALKLNNCDGQDAGFRKVYEFASHANREITGNAENFIGLLKTPVYQPLVGFTSVEFGRLMVGAECAEQSFAVVPASGGSAVKYVMTLTRESFGENAGCWLVDSISRE